MGWFALDIIEIESWASLGATGLSAAWVRAPAAVGAALIIVFLILRRIAGGWRGSPDDGSKPL
jgi:TRAP-type C4-dicarboxylate transport system permease small subunit